MRLGRRGTKPFTVKPSEVQAKVEPQIGETILVRVSHYWPPLLGVNCFLEENGKCISPLTNGQAWEDWVDVAVACPPQWPFETKVIIDGRTWICKDTGGAIIYEEDGIAWIDMLTEHALYPHGTLVEAQIIPP